MELENFEYDIVYIAGKDNKAADYLSRIVMPELEEVPGSPWELFNIELTARDLVTVEEICRLQEEDTETKEAIRQIQESVHVSSGRFEKLNNIQLNDGLLKKGRRIIVPEALQKTVVIACHSQSHPGVDNTLVLLKSRFY